MYSIENQVQLIGNLGRDPEQRVTESNRVVVKFSMATNSGYKDKAGEWQNVTTWHQVIVWGKFGELLAGKLKKGDTVLIVGSLKYNKWTDKDGINRERAYIEATGYKLFPKASNGWEPAPEAPANVGPRDQAETKTEEPAPEPGADDDLPF